jgi:hypothetical protein
VQRDGGSVDPGNENGTGDSNGDSNGDSTGDSTGNSTGSSTGGAQVLGTDALIHSPQELSRTEEEPANTHEIGNTLDQGLQHEVLSNTYASGHVVEGIYKPLYTSTNIPSSNLETIMAINKTATTNGADEIIENTMQSIDPTVHTTTAPKSNPQVSAMTSTTRESPPTPPGNSVTAHKTTTTNNSSKPMKNPPLNPDLQSPGSINTTNTPTSSPHNGNNDTNAPSTSLSSIPLKTNPISKPRYTPTLSLASTTTNKPPGPSFKPLKPIHNWVPPRPVIIARTEATDAEKAELRAEAAAREVEKKQVVEQKQKEMEVLRGGAKKAEVERRAREVAERVGSSD